MLKRFKEPSTWAGVGIAGLTYLQTTNDWKGALLAILGSVFAVVMPEGGKK